MEQEIQRYQNLVKLYPSSQIYCPEIFRCATIPHPSHFDINLTRYLYIKTYNSMPPDDIWSFRKKLGFKDVIESEENSHILEIKIGLLSDKKLSTKVTNIKVKSSDTFDKIISKLGFNCKLLVNNNSCININSKIDNTKTIYAVCYALE